MMAHIFKYYNYSQKGIIVFTHKEVEYFTYHQKSFSKLFTSIVKNPGNLISFIESLLISKYIRVISKHYFIGVHYGWAYDYEIDHDWIDFHLSGPTTIRSKSKHVAQICYLNSSNFVSKNIYKEVTDKYFDLISITKNTKNKNIDKLLLSVRKLYDVDDRYRVIIIISSNKREDERRYYTRIYDDYYNLFSPKERERFTILKTDAEMGFQGLSSTMISFFLNRSKAFTLFSSIEGSSKVVKEALACGLPIILYDKILGGALNYLNEGINLKTFKSYEKAHLIIKEVIDNYEKYSISVPDELNYDYNLNYLHSYFSDLYKKNGLLYDGKLINTDNLNRRLPSHYFGSGVYWATSKKFRYMTTDLSSLRMMKTFYSGLRLNKVI